MLWKKLSGHHCQSETLHTGRQGGISIHLLVEGWVCTMYCGALTQQAARAKEIERRRWALRCCHISISIEVQHKALLDLQPVKITGTRSSNINQNRYHSRHDADQNINQ
jgi:hypothetical protein